LEKVKLQRQKSEGQGHGIIWKVFQKECTYEIPSTYQSKVMTKIKLFEKKVKFQSQRSEDQGHGIKWKVLPERIHVWNMKDLPMKSYN
jgi:hypothetical protein